MIITKQMFEVSLQSKDLSLGSVFYPTKANKQYKIGMTELPFFFV